MKPQSTPEPEPEPKVPPEPRCYTCTVPRVAPSLNVWMRWHWARRERERQAFQWDLMAVLNEKGNRCPRGLERVRIRAVIACPVERRRDKDNFGAVLAKWVQDQLVRSGVIPDDTADRCTFMPPVLTVGESENTILVIEEVA